jgi:hypothetical protein
LVVRAIAGTAWQVRVPFPLGQKVIKIVLSKQSTSQKRQQLKESHKVLDDSRKGSVLISITASRHSRACLLNDAPGTHSLINM